MPKLRYKKDNGLIASHLIQAKTLKQRVKGLIGRSELKAQEAFWISSCPAIHTFFMRFPIDVVFTDRKFQVVSLFKNIPPRRICFGGLKSRNAFEMRAGQIEAQNVKKGDELYVEH